MWQTMMAPKIRCQTLREEEESGWQTTMALGIRLMKTAALLLLEGITVGFTFFPSFVALVHKIHLT
jgi:hypothetical protein